MLFVKVPVPVALLTFIPLAPTIVTLAFETAGLDEFGRPYVRIRASDYAPAGPRRLPYQVLLAVAALRAVWREFRGERGWEKTAHTASTARRDAQPLSRRRWRHDHHVSAPRPVPSAPPTRRAAIRRWRAPAMRHLPRRSSASWCWSPAPSG